VLRIGMAIMTDDGNMLQAAFCVSSRNGDAKGCALESSIAPKQETIRNSVSSARFFHDARPMRTSLGQKVRQGTPAK